MILEFLLFAVALGLVFLISEVLLPKLKSRIKVIKELKQRKKKGQAFKNKMKELEIL